jgi:hypothetical protein
MTPGLEDELARTLRGRAASIDTAPSYRLQPEVVVPRTDSPNSWWRGRAGQLSAAGLAAVLAAVLLLAYSALVRTPRSSAPADPASCDLRGSTPFATAMRVGLLPAGAVVLAGSADGDVLVARQRGENTVAVDLVDVDAKVTRLWTAALGQRVRVVANASGAISQSRVVFVIMPVGGAADPQTLVVDMQSKAVKAFRTDPGYRLSSDASSAPIVSDDALELIETSTGRAPARQQLALYWADGSITAPSTRQPVAAAVTSLLPVGGNTVLVRNGPAHAADTIFTDPQNRPTTLPAATRSGFAFASDATTMTWLTSTHGRRDLWQWAPGDASPRRRALPAGFAATGASGAFATERVATPAGTQRVLDSVSRRISTLPIGVSLVRVDAGTAVLRRHAGTETRYARVPLSDLFTCQPR